MYSFKCQYTRGYSMLFIIVDLTMLNIYQGRRRTDIDPTFTASDDYLSDIDPSSVVIWDNMESI